MRTVPAYVTLVWWLLFGHLLLAADVNLHAQPATLTKASQIRDLSAAEAAQRRPVRLRGVLTHYNPDWGGIFLQDDTGAAYLDHDPARDGGPTNLFPGQIIEVTGVTKVGPVHCDVLATALSVEGTGPLPEPLDLSDTNQLRVANERLRIKANGQVLNVGFANGHPRLQVITSSGLFLNVYLQTRSSADVADLNGAAIDFVGVLGLALTSEWRHNGQYNVLVTGIDAIHKIKSLPITPITPIADLVAGGPMARIRASIEELRPGSLLARDPTGVIRVEYQNQGELDLALGSAVEVFGRPERVAAAIVMKEARVAAPSGADPTLKVINSIAQIRSFSTPQAARGFPVYVKGVVTYHDPVDNMQFVQDETAGIYLGLNFKRFETLPPAGTRVEVFGFTDPGEFAPLIQAEEVRLIGPGKFPNAAPVPFQLLMTGTEDSQWLELAGVVRSVTVETNRAQVELSTGDAVIKLTVVDSHSAPTNLLGASIGAHGVCRSSFDAQRHFKGIELCVPDWSQIEIREGGAVNPFQWPLTPVSGLLQFHAGGYGLNRSHVRGRITLRLPEGQFFLQDGSGGILVHAVGEIPTSDWVEVVGFPGLRDQLPILQDALVRPAEAEAAATALLPRRLSPESALDDALNATLVTLDGRVLPHSPGTSEEVVTVQFGRLLTDAIWEKTAGSTLPQFLSGSTVRLTGVYVARLANTRRIESFQILLRSPADAILVSAPPWWNARRDLWIFGGATCVLLLSLAWVAALRQQVSRRTAELSVEIEERKRVEAQVKKTHQDMLEVSRQAGMAEIAVNVLHNVGNVLNSVVVSASVMTEKVRTSNAHNLTRVADLLHQHQSDLATFFTHDPKGAKLPGYVSALAERMSQEQTQMLQELTHLRENIDHIAGIVAMQQNFAKAYGLREFLSLPEVLETALQLDLTAFKRHGIKIHREYEALPPVEVEKHKLLQILVNLLQNAKNALVEGGRADLQLKLRVQLVENRARILVSDNGMGIASENLTRIFAHGFTTRKDGHGFGLHSSVIAAREMQGSLTAHSDGLGQGATFVLDLPAFTPEQLRAIG